MPPTAGCGDYNLTDQSNRAIEDLVLGHVTNPHCLGYASLAAGHTRVHLAADAEGLIPSVQTSRSIGVAVDTIEYFETCASVDSSVLVLYSSRGKR